MSEQGADLAAGVVKGMPPVTVGTAVLAGYTLQEWVLIATLVYTVLLIAQTVYRWFFPKRPTIE